MGGTFQKPGVFVVFFVSISFFILIHVFLMDFMLKVHINGVYCWWPFNMKIFLSVDRYKGAAKRNSNHNRDESYHVHWRWGRKETLRYCIKGMGFGEGLKSRYGQFIQDMRDPQHPEKLNPLVHSAILHPHYGLCMCVYFCVRNNWQNIHK